MAVVSQLQYTMCLQYIDFSKAFDIVQYDKLFPKLRACGVDGLLLQWIVNLHPAVVLMTCSQLLSN